MSAMMSQIIGVSSVCSFGVAIVYSTVCSGTDQRKHQCSASLAFVTWTVDSPHRGPVTRKMFHFMTSSYEVEHKLEFELTKVSPPHCTHVWFFHQFSFDGNVLHSHRCCSKVVATTFCTWHDSKAVVPFVKFRSDVITYSGVTHKPIFHRIWITMEEPFVKWAPRLEYRPLKGSDNT